jgi:1-acyl-sn-glycerol-3-phosphate acyltransferase
VQLPSGNNLITSHPHGILCLGPLLTIHLKPGSTTYFAVTPLLFKIPIFGWIISMMGCIPATVDHIKSALERSSVILVPGGIPEIILYETDEHYTRRYGLFKFKVPIVPIITLSVHYKRVKIPFKRLRVDIANRLGIPIVFPWLFGWYNTWLPKRTPIKVKVLDNFTCNGNIEECRLKYYSYLSRSSEIACL